MLLDFRARADSPTPSLVFKLATYSHNGSVFHRPRPTSAPTRRRHGGRHLRRPLPPLYARQRTPIDPAATRTRRAALCTSLHTVATLIRHNDRASPHRTGTGPSAVTHIRRTVGRDSSKRARPSSRQSGGPRVAGILRSTTPSQRRAQHSQATSIQVADS
ncbi:hypothetical protein HYPSUDRAFT_992485 [Hypholoma sublateritium FD-334 SS-4]|uniref:Uncharacterized protein n=1 Tax=Hypholoma sublateritium (strain FD-334 SS-4) TaxID=945553 RepID=A0A0D2Q6F1_HYPSF|nr:hypothetical protein HYPSUDRAFT_992485 [Hypholoma sublateritium FD-334 SS-4]